MLVKRDRGYPLLKIEPIVSITPGTYSMSIWPRPDRTRLGRIRPGKTSTSIEGSMPRTMSITSRLKSPASLPEATRSAKTLRAENPSNAKCVCGRCFVTRSEGRADHPQSGPHSRCRRACRHDERIQVCAGEDPSAQIPNPLEPDHRRFREFSSTNPLTKASACTS